MYEDDDDESVENFEYDEDISEDDEPETITNKASYRLNRKKFEFIKYAEFIPASDVSRDIDIGDIIHIIHRKYGYCYVQCLVDYIDGNYASIHRIDSSGYAERTYKFQHKHFLVFKMPVEYWKAVMSQSWKQLSIDTKDSINELEGND